MKTKALSLIAAAVLGAGVLTAAPAGNQANADLRIELNFGNDHRGHARHGRWDHRRHGWRRVHPRVVRHQLRRRGFRRIHAIRFHPRPIRARGGRIVRGFYTARAWKRGRPFIVYVNRAGRPFMRRPLRRRW